LRIVKTAVPGMGSASINEASNKIMVYQQSLMNVILLQISFVFYVCDF
jgi:hypothetical protein